MTSGAVVLARGLGTRMRRDDPAATQSAAQARVADAGLKAMIPVGRPFLDHALTRLADAGINRACLVIGPEHGVVREYYTQAARPSRLAIDFAIQAEARGTADAVAAAEAFADSDPFLVVNGDNLYPVPVLRDVAAPGGPAVAAFDRDDLVRTSGIGHERIRRFALLDVTADGFLSGITEKPGEAEYDARRPPVLISMNCWAFDARIFEACRSIDRSPRGEYELASAVGFAVQRLGMRIRVVPAAGRVLDLSTRADIAGVADVLRQARVAF